MQLRIRQSDINYYVYLNDSLETIFHGAWESKWFKRKCLLFDRENKLRIHVESSFRIDFWNMTYHIIVPAIKIDNYLKPIKIFKGHWRSVIGDDIFDFYLHQGHRKSLFKNGKQIAAYDKSKFQLFESDTFLINCNDNENMELVLSFELCFDLGTSNDGATATFDIGNISKGIREFDHNWKPHED